MRVLVLTSDNHRHLHLIQCLLDKGYEVLAWGEPKGQNLNQRDFADGHDDLLSIHQTALDTALKEQLPPIATDDLPLTVLERGIFKDERMVADAKRFAPHVVLTYGCGIVGQPLVEAFDGRILGSHQGLPQYYRGSGSNFFAFVEGNAAYMGVSLHLLDDGIDTGSVLAQVAPQPTTADTYYSHSAHLVALTIHLYAQVLEELDVENLPSEAHPLGAKGKLYQRKDFTHDLLKASLLMQVQHPFHYWYQHSLATVGPPELMGKVSL